MDILVKVMDCIVMQVVWFCYVVYNNWIQRGNKPTNKLPAIGQFQDEEQNERHFIHLYTTSQQGGSGRPVCYMDVYKMSSPLEEQKLRDACSKGVPNKTYLRYQRRRKSKPLPQYRPEDWLEYSTIAL